MNFALRLVNHGSSGLVALMLHPFMTSQFFVEGRQRRVKTTGIKTLSTSNLVRARNVLLIVAMPVSQVKL